MKLYVILLVVAMAAFGFVSGQISFEEEEEELPKVSNEQDVVMTRLGILQSLLGIYNFSLIYFFFFTIGLLYLAN